MAQKISMDEYNKQSSDYTKKALEELNEQMKEFLQNKESNNENYNEDSYEEEDSSSNESFVREKRKRIIIESMDPNPKQNTKKSNTKKIVDYEAQLKIQTLRNEIKALEIKNYNLTLQLSNSNCNFEESKLEVSVLQKRLNSYLQMRWFIILYMFFANVCSFFYCVSLPPMDFLTTFPFFAGYVYAGVFIYTKLYPKNIPISTPKKKNV